MTLLIFGVPSSMQGASHMNLRYFFCPTLATSKHVIVIITNTIFHYLFNVSLCESHNEKLIARLVNERITNNIAFISNNTVIQNK